MLSILQVQPKIIRSNLQKLHRNQKKKNMSFQIMKNQNVKIGLKIVFKKNLIIVNKYLIKKCKLCFVVKNVSGQWSLKKKNLLMLVVCIFASPLKKCCLYIKAATFADSTIYFYYKIKIFFLPFYTFFGWILKTLFLSFASTDFTD